MPPRAQGGLAFQAHLTGKNGKNSPLSAFPAPPKPGRSVFEFFYATYEDNKWKMQGHGLYNSPLLYPDALACLFQVIRDELKKEPEACGEGLDLCGCVC